MKRFEWLSKACHEARKGLKVSSFMKFAITSDVFPEYKMMLQFSFSVIFAIRI